MKLAGVNVTFYSSDQSELLAFQSGQIDSDPAVAAALGSNYRQQRSGSSSSTVSPSTSQPDDQLHPHDLHR